MVERMQVARQLEALNQVQAPTAEEDDDELENLEGLSPAQITDLRMRKHASKKTEKGDDLNQRMSEGISVRSGKDIHTDLDLEQNSSNLSNQSEQRDYNPLDGFTFYFDYVSRLFKQFNAMKFVFALQKVNE